MTEESPDQLTGGTWQTVPGTGGLRRWVPAPPAPPRPAADVACPTCGAAVDDWCRTLRGRKIGRVTQDHDARTIPRACLCGNPPHPRRRYCDDCAVERRRKQWRDSKRRTTAAARQAAA